jgi:hypothetical protein
MAVRAVAEGAAAEGTTAEGAAAAGAVHVAGDAATSTIAPQNAANEGATAEGAAAGLMQTAACQALRVQIAAEEQLLTAVYPAPVQTPTEQAPAARQPTKSANQPPAVTASSEQLATSTQAVQSSAQLIADHAAVHKVWEQQWSTISEHEEGGMHDQFSQANQPDRLETGRDAA